MSDKKSIIESGLAKWILAIVALLSLGWAIFQTYHVKTPKLRYEIVSQAKMFNKSERLSTVQLLVDTVDVLKENQNISFFVIKIQNIGNQHLRWDDYDEGRFGLSVQNGQILQEVAFDSASVQHIEDRYNEQSLDFSEAFIEIPKISLDRNEWYMISFSVIHDDGVTPSFVPFGKIIGQDKIQVIASSDTEQLSYSEKLFFGSFWINLVRAIVFLLIWIIIIIIIGFIVIEISDFLDDRKRERVLKQITQDSEIPAFIRDDYLKNKDINISIAYHYFGMGDAQLNLTYTNALDYLSHATNVTTDDFDRYKTLYVDINGLIEKGYLTKDGNGIIMIPRIVKDSVFRILNLLKENKLDTYRIPFAFARMHSDIEIEDWLSKVSQD